MRKFSNINESVWGDMRKRAEGHAERKEDDVNNMDVDGLVKYLNDNYQLLKPEFGLKINGREISGRISEVSVPIYYNSATNANYIRVFMQIYEEHDYVYLHDMFFRICRSTYNKLTDVFDVDMIDEDRGRWHINIAPKDGSKANHKFFIEVLDFLLENANEPYRPILKKI